jgi:Tfp pilus assembly protein FimV
MPPPATTALPNAFAQRPFHALQRASWLLLGAVAVFSACPAQAADTSAAAASALKVLSTPLSDAGSAANASDANPTATAGKHPAASITVQKGESIDAAIRRGLPGLALNEEFMRQALAKANPRIFPKGRTYPVRPGTVLLMPTHEALRQQILLQYPQTAALFQAANEPAESSSAAAGPDKRRWVRFP